MKRSIVIVLIFLSNKIFCQGDTLAVNYGLLDTIETYTNILISDGPNGYSVNSRQIDKKTYEGYKRAMDNTDNCKPCWLKEYSIDGDLESEGVYYGGECPVSTYSKYQNGQKIIGHYKENHSGNWSDFISKGFCGIKDGLWTYYDEQGRIFKSET